MGCDATDSAAVTNLTEEHGWLMPFASTIFRKVESRNDAKIPGCLILSLSGGSGIRVWATGTPSTNDVPLLVSGQTITNGIAGANFVSYPDSMIYVEAIDAGTASLTYSYAGTGNAEEYGCAAELNMTAVKVELEPVTTEANAQGLIFNPCGVATNGLATYRVVIEPAAIQDDDIKWSVASGGVAFYNGHDTGREVIIRGGASESDFQLEVQIDGFAETCRPYIHGRVLEPRTVQIRAYVICDANGVAAVSAATINAWITEANRIYRQVAVTFTLADIKAITTQSGWFEIGNNTEFNDMTSYTNNTGGLELYCVNLITGSDGKHSDMRLASGDPRRGMAVAASASLQTLAHEIGHACGLSDMYLYDAGDGPVSLENTLSLNWSGGNGTGFYSPSLAYRDLTHRIIMHNHNNTDIPLYYLTGICESIRVSISVGLNQMNRDPVH